MADWYSGSGHKTNIQDIYTSLKLHTQNNNKIFIGTDSFVSREKVCFASAICLHGETVAKYFFIKEYDEPKKYIALVSRITEEVRRSVEIAENIIYECNISAAKGTNTGASGVNNIAQNPRLKQRRTQTCQ